MAEANGNRTNSANTFTYCDMVFDKRNASWKKIYAGGVFVSYLEYAQEAQRDQMTLEIVERRLQGRMQSKFDEVFDYAGDKNLTMRQAAMDLALDRAFQGVISRGLWP